jgi:hypothetical protein
MQLVGLRLPAVVPERAAQMVLFCLFLSAPSVGAAQLQVGTGSTIF